MTDALFARPRLAEIYDLVEEERNDLDHYLAIAAEFGARSVLDVGCGTGTADGTTVTSDSTRRFWSRAEIEASLRSAGYTLVDVHDAPDRPGSEWIFIARKPGPAS